MVAIFSSLLAAVTLAPFGEVKLIDEIDCTKSDHRFEDYPKGSSRVETIAGKPCRLLEVQADKSSFLNWRIGEGKSLKPNGAYVLVIEYPDDKPRDYYIRNYGNNSHRSFYTGAAIGDPFDAPIVGHHPESLRIPQSGKYEKWTALTFIGTKASKRRDDGKLDITTEGFDVVVAQYKKKHHPESAGVAVKTVALYEILDEKSAWVELRLPPSPLPKRHIFWREEMSDGVMSKDGICPGNAGLDWQEQKMRAMKIFAQNTFCKDLLEFGHNQHWDCNWKHGKPGGKSWKWMWASDAYYANLWTRLVPLACEKYGFNILPYYEYGGAAGDPKFALGPQKRAEPLDMNNKPEREKRGANYTHIWWSEGKLRVDITDSDTLDELKYVLEGTIVRFKDAVDKGAFIGAIMRPRPGHWAVSFADATRARFAKEANGGKSVSRDDLKRDKALYARYIQWWSRRRAKFMDDIRRYLEENGVKDAMAILENDASEPGRGLSGRWGVITDDPDSWKKIVKNEKAVVDANDPSILSEHLFLKSLKTPSSTWGAWEWQHAIPAGDPENYAAFKNVWLALPYSKCFSVNDPHCFSSYSNANGTQTLIYHYGLNEHVIEDKLVGYSMADFERAGRACMASEVIAMANGDPVNLGYLMGSNYTRGFPQAVREFNRNFLALPAVKSKIVKGACSDPEVVLREIDCTAFGVKSRYYALVHTGMTEKKNVAVKIPGARGAVELAAYGKVRQLSGGALEFRTLKPFQLIALKTK